MDALSKAFHDHLDKCDQCRNHPLALCPIGKDLLYKAVHYEFNDDGSLKPDHKKND